MATTYEDKYKQSGGSLETYSDFLHTFIPHPHTKQITRKVDVDAIKQALRNLVLTNKYERLRQPDFGGNIRNYLFENFNQINENNLRSEILNTIERFEQRVHVDEIIINENQDMNRLEISIIFSVSLTAVKEQVDLALYRIR